MKSLSGLDATFLYLETPETPMHVGSLNVYELPKGSKGSFHKAVRDHIARRMHLAPILTRRLAFMPFGLGHPGWVEADEVDLHFHIRKVPGGALTVKQAEAVAAKLHSRLIDRDRPLWEFHVFDNIKAPPGLDVEGRLVGLYSKIHHAALDGRAGTVLANALLDLGPAPREVPPPARGRHRDAGMKIGEMVGAVFSNSMAQYAKIVRSLPSAVASVGGAITKIERRSALSLAPKTIFNAGITSDRAFTTATISFADCRAIAKAAGGSFNDVVLWLCSTALRDYLAQQGALPKKTLVAAMPISLREESNKDFNNQASITLVDLATNVADPAQRMAAIVAATARVKGALAKLKSMLPTDYPSLLAPWLVGGAGKALFRTYGANGVTQRLPAIANLAISNVPGPQAPLYLAGARMVTFHPLSIILHGLALNITIQTYAGSVDFGIVSCPKAVPRASDLARAIEKALDEAKALFAPAQEPITQHDHTHQPRPARTRPRPARA